MPLLNRSDFTTDAAFREATWLRVLEDRPFVITIAKRYVRPGVSLADLIQEALIAAYHAALKFDETRGANFLSYAGSAIKFELSHWIDESSRVIRIPRWAAGMARKVVFHGLTLESLTPNKRECVELAINVLYRRCYTGQIDFGGNTTDETEDETEDAVEADKRSYDAILGAMGGLTALESCSLLAIAQCKGLREVSNECGATYGGASAARFRAIHKVKTALGIAC